MECRICHKGYKILGKHIRTHDISVEDYYLRFIGNKGKCEICDKPTEFNTLYSGYKRFCSKDCADNWQSGRTFRRKNYHRIKCKFCGKVIEVPPSQKNRKFCSVDCYNDYKSEMYIGKGNPFYGKHHSKETLVKISGVNNHFWNGGVTTEERNIRNSWKYSNWREKVFERDDYTCQFCDVVGKDIQAHHIKAFAKYPKERLNVDNGITLCKDCHKYVHGLDGSNMQ